MGDLYGWNWAKFRGSEDAIRLNRRDLACLDAVIAITPGRTAAVQAGGALGLFPKRLAQVFRTVYTFEPSAELFPLLTQNAPEPNILKYQAALGETRGLVGTSRVRRDGKPNPHELITHIQGVGVVPVLRIDDLALPVCDLIYLDIEGYELHALGGALETLRRCRPVVSLEINKNIKFEGATRDDVRDRILAEGYRLVTRLRDDDVFLPTERAA